MSRVLNDRQGKEILKSVRLAARRKDYVLELPWAFRSPALFIETVLLKSLDRTLRLVVATRLRKLSAIDKKILKILLAPSDRISSHALAIKLGLPRTTIQRRRNFLEKHFLEFAYSLKLGELGYRRVDLLIYTGGGDTVRIANKLLERDEVVYVGRSIGEHTIDLRAEVIIKDNSQLLDLLEEVKAMPSVRDVVWSEIVRIVGKKRSVPAAIIDSM